MNNITLSQVVKCELSGGYIPAVNCTHWNYNSDTCSTYCTLKNKFVSYHKDCYKCTERVEKNKSSSPADQMKKLMEQKNYYTNSKSGIKINEESKPELSFMDKAKSYSAVEGSQFLEGKVSEDVFNSRKEHCLSCPKLVNPSPETEKIGWCGGCGCSSRNPRASLTNKLYMPKWICPMGKFGKEKGEGFNVSDAANSVKGVFTSVKNLFNKEEEDDKEKNKE